jgi:hypothetical protein
MHFTPPPRHVPTSLKIANFFNPMAQIGWLVAGFGLVFFWGFVMNADFSFVTFRGPLVVIDGKVTSVKDTGASVNNRRVQKIGYEYQVAGVMHTGTSYNAGSDPSEGEIVPVEYTEDDPSQSRIEGMRRAMFPPAVLFVTIFPAIGLAILIFATRSGLRRNYLLREGVLAMGTLKSKSATNMTVNKRRVYKLTFEFISRDGRRCEVSSNTSQPRMLENEDQEPLLYDPSNPSRAYLLDETARPEIEPNGDLSGRPRAAVLSMFLPLLIIAAHVAYFWFKFRPR